MTKYIDTGHVGDILREEFMEPLGLSMNALARAIDMPANCTRYLGLSQGYFLRLQNRLDMVAAKRAITEDELLKIVPINRPNTQPIVSIAGM